MELENKKNKIDKTIILGGLLLILFLFFSIASKSQIVKNFRLYLANILNPYNSTLELKINDHLHNFETEDNEVIIEWKGVNVVLCVASSVPEIKEWVGEKDIKGEERLFINTSTTFIMTCAGPGGLVSKEISVNLISKEKAEIKPLFKKIEFKKAEEKEKKTTSKVVTAKTVKKITPSVKKLVPSVAPDKKQTSLNPSLIFKINNSEKEINVKPDEKITISWEAQNVNKCLAFSQPINSDWNNLINLKGTKTIEKLGQSTTFGIFCTYERGYITKNIMVNIYIPNPLKVEFKANDQADKVFIPYNSGVVLSWNSENSEKCEAFSNPEIENWKGEIPFSGKRSILNLTKDTRFSIKCSNKYQTIEKYIEVKIVFGGGGGRITSMTTGGTSGTTNGSNAGSTSTLAISVNLKINNQEGPITVNKGDSVTLSWQSTNARQCTVSASPYYPEWSGFKEPQGSINIYLNKAGTTTFSISCIDENGNDAVDQVIVYVREVNKFVDLKVNGLDNVRIPRGNIVNVRWNSYGVISCTVSSSPYLEEWSGVKQTSGETNLGPINEKTTLSISCIDEQGNGFVDQAIIDVE